MDKVYSEELILLGSICYYEDLDSEACSKENKSIIFVEPDGFFKFAPNSRDQEVLMDSDQKTQIFFQVVREFGSLNNVEVIYSTTSASMPFDFYFYNYSQLVKFDKLSYANSFSLNVNRIFVKTQRDFYIYLIGVISELSGNETIYQTNKISKYYYYSTISLLPPHNEAEFENVFAFIQNSMIIVCVKDITVFDVSLLIFRLGARKNVLTASVTVKSAGYNDSIPEWIKCSQPSSNSTFLLALSTYEFQVVDTKLYFDEGEDFFNLTLSINSNFSTDLDFILSPYYHSRYFYLYLSNPSNGARLIEPTNSPGAFSPYVKLELRKFPILSSDLKRDTIQIGFVKSSVIVNQSIYLKDYNYTYSYMLDWPRPGRSRYYENSFHLKWIATVLDYDRISSIAQNFSIRDILNCTFYHRSMPAVCEGIISCNNISDINCTFDLEFKRNLPDLQEIYGLKISLAEVDAFAYKTKTYNVSIRNDTNEVFLYLKTSLFSKVRFDKYSLFSVSDKFKLYAKLVVERSGVLNSSLELIYATHQLSHKNNWFDFNGFKMYPAISGYDYDPIGTQKITFKPGEKVKFAIFLLQVKIVIIKLKKFKIFK